MNSRQIELSGRKPEGVDTPRRDRSISPPTELRFIGPSGGIDRKLALAQYYQGATIPRGGLVGCNGDFEDKMFSHVMIT